MIVMRVSYRILVRLARAARCCIIWWKCACVLGWSCAIAKVSQILACERTSSRSIPIVFEADHGGAGSLASLEYVSVAGF